jgi:hypothetical protein
MFGFLLFPLQLHEGRKGRVEDPKYARYRRRIVGGFYDDRIESNLIPEVLKKLAHAMRY